MQLQFNHDVGGCFGVVCEGLAKNVLTGFLISVFIDIESAKGSSIYMYVLKKFVVYLVMTFYQYLDWEAIKQVVTFLLLYLHVHADLLLDGSCIYLGILLILRCHCTISYWIFAFYCVMWKLLLIEDLAVPILHVDWNTL